MKQFINIIISLILTLNIYAQKTCVDSENLFVITDTMPEPSPSLASIEQQVNGKYSTTECGLVENDKFLVQFTLNCEGQDFDYNAMKFNKEPLECDLAEFLQSTLNWTIAKQRDKEVDFSGTLVFKVENSTFILLSESVNNTTENKKKKKNKK
jgi:hypothetical protein